jgi:hypothetical protein
MGQWVLRKRWIRFLARPRPLSQLRRRLLGTEKSASEEVIPLAKILLGVPPRKLKERVFSAMRITPTPMASTPASILKRGNVSVEKMVDVCMGEL